MKRNSRSSRRYLEDSTHTARGGKLIFAQAADPVLVRPSFKLQFQLEYVAEGFEVWQTFAKDLRSKYCTFCVEKIGKYLQSI